MKTFLVLLNNIKPDRNAQIRSNEKRKNNDKNHVERFKSGYGMDFSFFFENSPR